MKAIFFKIIENIQNFLHQNVMWKIYKSHSSSSYILWKCPQSGNSELFYTRNIKQNGILWCWNRTKSFRYVPHIFAWAFYAKTYSYVWARLFGYLPLNCAVFSVRSALFILLPDSHQCYTYVWLDIRSVQTYLVMLYICLHTYLFWNGPNGATIQHVSFTITFRRRHDTDVVISWPKRQASTMP